MKKKLLMVFVSIYCLVLFGPSAILMGEASKEPMEVSIFFVKGGRGKLLGRNSEFTLTTNTLVSPVAIFDDTQVASMMLYKDVNVVKHETKLLTKTSVAVFGNMMPIRYHYNGKEIETTAGMETIISLENASATKAIIKVVHDARRLISWSNDMGGDKDAVYTVPTISSMKKEFGAKITYGKWNAFLTADVLNAVSDTDECTIIVIRLLPAIDYMRTDNHKPTNSLPNAGTGVKPQISNIEQSLDE